VERLAMLVEEPEDKKPFIAVVPEHVSVEVEAQAIAAHLRRADMAVELGFRGNTKRRVEAARSRGVEAILFVREDGATEKLNLTHISRDTAKATELLLSVLGHLPDKYDSLAGDNA
jgi:histidyl-tRNA synthetase